MTFGTARSSDPVEFRPGADCSTLPNSQMTTRTASRSRRLVLAISLADALLLRWVGVEWPDQALFLLTVGLWCLSGTILCKALPTLPRCRPLLLALSTAFGMCFHSGLCFLLFHRVVFTAMGTTLAGAARVAYAVLALVALFGILPFIRTWKAYGRGNLGGGAALFAICSIVAAAAAFGYGATDRGGAHAHRIVPDAPYWGLQIDRLIHLEALPTVIAREGLPNRDLQHLGVQVSLLAMSLLTGSDDVAPRVVAFSKPACLLWYFLATYAHFAISRFVLRLSRRVALVAAAAVLLYGAINSTWLPGSPSLRSSSIVYPAGCTTYHNVTQVAGMAVGFCGLLLVLLDQARPSRAFVAGCLLIASSFFFKPALISVVAPALLLFVLLRHRTALTGGALIGLLAVASAPVVYAAYSVVMQIEVRTTPVAFDFFWPLRAQPDSPHFIPPMPALQLAHDSTARRILAYFLSGYAAWVLPVLACLAMRFRSNPDGGCRAGTSPASRLFAPPAMLLWTIFVLGTLGGLCLVEDNEFWACGNFLWGFAIAQFCVYPFLSAMLAEMRPTSLKVVAYAVFALHLLSGVGNLFLFARSGDIGAFPYGMTDKPPQGPETQRPPQRAGPMPPSTFHRSGSPPPRSVARHPHQGTAVRT